MRTRRAATRPQAACGDAAAAARSDRAPRRRRDAATRPRRSRGASGGGSGRGAGRGAARRSAGAPAAQPGNGRGAARSRTGARRRTADRTRRRPAARVVSRHPDSARHDRQLVAPQQHQLHADRRALWPPAHVDDPEPGRRELLPEDAELDRVGQDRPAARLRHPGPARHDARRRAGEHPPHPADRDRRGTSEIKVSDGTFPAGSYVIKRDQPYGRLAKNLLERQSYPIPTCAPTTTAAGRWGWRCSPTFARSRTRRSSTSRPRR